VIFDFDFKSFRVADFDFDFKIILRLIYDFKPFVEAVAMMDSLMLRKVQAVKTVNAESEQSVIWWTWWTM